MWENIRSFQNIILENTTKLENWFCLKTLKMRVFRGIMHQEHYIKDNGEMILHIEIGAFL